MRFSLLLAASALASASAFVVPSTGAARVAARAATTMSA